MDAAVSDVTVDDDGDDLVVHWELEGGEVAVDIAVGPTPEAIDHKQALTVDDGRRSVRLSGLGHGRHYVSVAPHGGGGAVVAAERRVRFEQVTNFRDIGGYRTVEGKRTRWGQVFRSDALHRLTSEEMARYQALGLRAVYDLRGDAERERHPNPFPSTQLALIAQAATGANPPVSPASLPEVTPPMDAAGGEQTLRDLYGRMLANAGPLFGRLLTGLAEPGGLPAVIHCTGGKDRTGLTVALLLELLRVPRDQVLDDYVLTSQFRRREHQSESYESLLAAGMGVGAAVAVLGAPRWAMAETLEELDQTYGGVRAYLSGPAGIPVEILDRLRSLLTA